MTNRFCDGQQFREEHTNTEEREDNDSIHVYYMYIHVQWLMNGVTHIL